MWLRFLAISNSNTFHLSSLVHFFTLPLQTAITALDLLYCFVIQFSQVSNFTLWSDLCAIKVGFLKCQKQKLCESYKVLIADSNIKGWGFFVVTGNIKIVGNHWSLQSNSLWLSKKETRRSIFMFYSNTVCIFRNNQPHW